MLISLSLDSTLFFLNDCLQNNSYPHEEAGQIPMAFIVRQPGNNLKEAEIMDFIAKQVSLFMILLQCFCILRIEAQNVIFVLYYR